MWIVGKAVFTARWLARTSLYWGVGVFVMSRIIALMGLISVIPWLGSCAANVSPEEYKALATSGNYSFFLKTENFAINKPYKVVSADFLHNFEKCFNYIFEYKTPMMSARAAFQVNALVKRNDESMTQVVVTERGNLNVGEGPPRILVEIQPEGKNATRLQYYGAESWLVLIKDWGHGPITECPEL